MIHVIAEIEVQPGKRDEFLRQFHQLVPQVLQEEGCLEYGPALERHLLAPHMVQYRSQVKDLVVHTQIRVLEPAANPDAQ